MNHNLWILFVVWSTHCFAALPPSIYTPYQAAAEALVNSMTLEQQVGQMLLPTFDLLTTNQTAANAAWAANPGPFSGLSAEQIQTIGTACGFQTISELYVGGVLQAAGPLTYSGNDQSVMQWQRLGGIAQSFYNGPAGTLLLTGNDAVHGNMHATGSVLFPHNIGMGATHDPLIAMAEGIWTKRTVLNCNFNWAYAPTVAVMHDCRWGRFYESYAAVNPSIGANPALIKVLTQSFIEGLQDIVSTSVTGMLGSAKHFIGDGATQAGVDEGYATSPSLQAIWTSDGIGYEGAVIANIGTVMASYSSLNGMPMHFGGDFNILNQFRNVGIQGSDNETYQLGGFVVSDYNGVTKAAAVYNALHNTTLSLAEAIAFAVNGGVDMMMVAPGADINPLNYDFPPPDQSLGFCCCRGGNNLNYISSSQPPANLGGLYYTNLYQVRDALLEAIQKGLIPLSRINGPDGAATRILRTKLALQPSGANAADLSAPEITQMKADALTAAQESLVLLKNNALLPIAPGGISNVFLMGSYDDIGVQNGGWTINWQGQKGNGFWAEGSADKVNADASSILDGVKSLLPGAVYFLGENSVITGDFSSVTSANSVAIIALSEYPYAEYNGDLANENPFYTLGALTDQNLYIKLPQPIFVGALFSKQQLQAIQRLQGLGVKIITVLFSGRPLVITEGSPSPLGASDAFIAAFLPGTSGGKAIANAIFGTYFFKSKSSVIDGISYSSNTLSFPWPSSMREVLRGTGTLFPVNFGLATP